MSERAKIIAISQRVDVIADRGERRDALDQRWSGFLQACGYQMAPLPNAAGTIPALLDALRPVGIILSGGNDLAELGGDAPERDAAERAMLAWASKGGVPVVGVCRGLQLILHDAGAPLKRVSEHVAKRHRLSWLGCEIDVNSYHNWSTQSVPAGYEATARSDDGNIEALQHTSKPVAGVMWHPERETPFAQHDIDYFRTAFEAKR